MKIAKKDRAVIFRAIFLVAVFCLLLSSVIILFNRSFAWLAQNREVNADGMSVNLKSIGIEDKYYVSYDGVNYTEVTSWNYIFKGTGDEVSIGPGDKVYIRAEYNNVSDKTHNLELHYQRIGDNDTPIIKEVGGASRYYYLATQLKVTTAKIDGGTETAINEFLTAPPDNKIYYEQETQPNDIALGNLTIAPSAKSTIEFTIEFVNYTDIDQNDYQGYGEGAETCSRMVVAYISE